MVHRFRLLFLEQRLRVVEALLDLQPERGEVGAGHREPSGTPGQALDIDETPVSPGFFARRRIRPLIVSDIVLVSK